MTHTGRRIFIPITVPKKVTNQSPYYVCVTYLAHNATVPNEHWASLIQTRPRKVRLLSTSVSVSVVKFVIDTYYDYVSTPGGMYIGMLSTCSST